MSCLYGHQVVVQSCYLHLIHCEGLRGFASLQHTRSNLRNVAKIAGGIMRFSVVSEFVFPGARVDLYKRTAIAPAGHVDPLQSQHSNISTERICNKPRRVADLRGVQKDLHFFEANSVLIKWGIQFIQVSLCGQ